MKIFKRFLAILCWILMVASVINMFINSAYGLFPMSLALIVMLFRWGYDLWVVDPETTHVKGWVRSLIFIGVHIGLFLVCGLIGVTVSVFVANGDSLVTNWIFFITIFFMGMWLKPKKFLPKNKENKDTETVIEVKMATNE